MTPPASLMPLIRINQPVSFLSQGLSPKYSPRLWLNATSNSDDGSPKGEVFNELPSDDFQSRLKAQLCSDPAFSPLSSPFSFFEGNHLTYILEIPPSDWGSRRTHTWLRILHFTCHHFSRRRLIWICRKSREGEEEKKCMRWERNSQVRWTSCPGIPMRPSLPPIQHAWKRELERKKEGDRARDGVVGERNRWFAARRWNNREMLIMWLEVERRAKERSEARCCVGSVNCFSSACWLLCSKYNTCKIWGKIVSTLHKTAC